MKKENTKTVEVKNKESRKIEWMIFRPEIFAMIMMFFYGYAIALLGTGYELKIFGAGMAAIVILFIIMLIELILNLVKKDKRSTSVDANDDETRLDDPIDIFDEQELNDDYEVDPAEAYHIRKENDYDNRG